MIIMWNVIILLSTLKGLKVFKYAIILPHLNYKKIVDDLFIFIMPSTNGFMEGYAYGSVAAGFWLGETCRLKQNDYSCFNSATFLQCEAGYLPRNILIRSPSLGNPQSRSDNQGVKCDTFSFEVICRL